MMWKGKEEKPSTDQSQQIIGIEPSMSSTKPHGPKRGKAIRQQQVF